MIKIDIPAPVPMAMSGKGILSMMGKSLSSIDLLVRESLQNSLDACLDTYANKCVEVNFMVGSFRTKELNYQLNSLGSEINKNITNEYSDFIAVEDKNTVGLNGSIKYQPSNNNYGNFRKLVYEIAKPQQNEDAGGSWGYGKSVYFRIGMGLVIYYSRFKESNVYKERLACTYIEDETSCHSILNKIQPSNRGIAWLGDIDPSDGSSSPIEDSYEINKILNIFKFNNYSGDETGTRIIIPYIDKEGLLEDLNVKREQNNQDEFYFWKNNFEETLKNSIMLWYTPRINNLEYTTSFNKPYLKVSINNEKIKFNSDENYFYKVISELYKAALYSNNKPSFEYLPTIDNMTGFNNVPIKYSNISMDKKAGTVAFCKMPINAFDVSPYTYLGKENQSENGNSPIICFTRKPGMIVDYQLSDKWADRIPATDADEVLLGVFVLNTNAVFKGDYRLETYVRNSEGADHTSWVDFHIKGENPGRVILTICKNTQKAIKNAYTPKSTNQEQRVIGISQKLGKLFLPTTGYGHTPTTGVRPKGESKRNITKVRESSLQIKKVKHLVNNELLIDFELAVKNDSLIIDSIVKGIGGDENLGQWNSIFNTMPPCASSYPIVIKNATIDAIYIGNKKNNLLSSSIEIEQSIEVQNLDFSLKGSLGKNTSIKIKRHNKDSYIVVGSIIMETADKGFLYSIKLNKGVGDNE